MQTKDILRTTLNFYGRWGHLRLFLRNGKDFRYDGFQRADHDRLKVMPNSVVVFRTRHLITVLIFMIMVHSS
jgi:hypothetical protein